MFTKKVFFIYLSLALFNLQNINACQNPQCQQGSSIGAASQIAISQAITIGMFSIVGLAAYKIWNIGNLATKADLAVTNKKIEVMQLDVTQIKDDVTEVKANTQNLKRGQAFISGQMDDLSGKFDSMNGTLNAIAEKHDIQPTTFTRLFRDTIAHLDPRNLFSSSSAALSSSAAGSSMSPRDRRLSGDGDNLQFRCQKPLAFHHGNLSSNSPFFGSKVDLYRGILALRIQK